VDRMSNPNRLAGLTLIELSITLAVLAIAVTVAAPSMQQLLHGNRLRTEASRLLDSLNLARSEAVVRNTPVALCPSSRAADGNACSGHYADGWIVFSDTDRDGTFDERTDELIRAFAAVPAGYSLTNLAGTRPIEELISYLPDGSSRRNLSFLFCAPRASRVRPWSVVLNSVGRARMARGEGQCPGSAG